MDHRDKPGGDDGEERLGRDADLDPGLRRDDIMAGEGMVLSIEVLPHGAHQEDSDDIGDDDSDHAAR